MTCTPETTAVDKPTPSLGTMKTWALEDEVDAQLSASTGVIVVVNGIFDANNARSDVVSKPGRSGRTECRREDGNGEGPGLGVLSTCRVICMSVRGISRVNITRLSVEWISDSIYLSRGAVLGLAGIRML